MKTYQVTVSVERHDGTPVARLGSATFTVDASSAADAESIALAAVEARWAVGGKFVAHADEWEES